MLEYFGSLFSWIRFGFGMREGGEVCFGEKMFLGDTWRIIPRETMDVSSLEESKAGCGST